MTDHGGPTSDPRVNEGLEHLQAAALEVIAAARAFLDVAEDLVRDPAAAAATAKAAAGVAAVLADQVTRRPPSDEADAAPPGDDEGGDRVRHIRLS